MSDGAYDAKARAELARWQAKMVRQPGPLAKATREMQDSINRLIPEKVHQAITAAMEHMTRAILTGSGVTTSRPLREGSLEAREAKVRQRIKAFRAVAAAEGGVAGAGGFLLAAADFPVLITIKIKLLFEIAALYGHDDRDFRERLYMLSIFQLAFSSARHRHEVFAGIEGWEARRDELPASPEAVDWRRFQQEYRDYIDLAKLAQMLPLVGAPVGLVVNYRLLDQLGDAAMNAYRMRWFAAQDAPSA
jgi:EcsC family protein